VKAAHKEQGKAVMDVHFVIRVILKAVLYNIKMKHLSLKVHVGIAC